MSTTYLSVDYFPLTVNFFDRDAIELAEAKYGIRVDGAVCKLLCKIFKEGYYIPWGEEQSLIFARKLGGELKGKAEEEEDNTASPSLEIPGYAYNKSTHNVKGLLDSLAQHGVTNKKEITAILKLSDYGKKGTQIWITLSTTKWGKIDNPGRYIISTLRT